MQKYHLLAFCLCAVLGSGVRRAEGQGQRDGDRLYETGRQLFELIPEPWREQMVLPSAAEWGIFWGRLEQSLQSEDLLDLAWILPEAEVALRVLRLHPAAEPYTDWLQPRMDFLEMAQQVLRLFVDRPEFIRPAPSTPPARVPALPTPPPRPAVGVSPREKLVMQQTARSQTNWDRKLAGRAAPARAAILVPGLKRIFAEEGVPPALVWLAEVESSFNPSARSPVGATGLFQFMPATAERFGMALTPHDERLDPNRSARAAAQYLLFLHGRFNAWPLALAAYNAGEGRVGGLLRRHNGVTFDDIAGHLPSETQMYVPKVLSIVAMREGIDPDRLPPPAALGVRR